MTQPTATSAAESSTAAMSGRLASAAAIANPFQKAIADAIVARQNSGGITPKLIGILATPSPPSVAYAQWTKKACEQVGVEFEIWQTWSEASAAPSSDAMEGVEQETKTNGGAGHASTDLEADVEDLIIAANGDDSIHGIMVYYPIFGGRQDTYLQQIVDPRKDVEGLHFSYCFNMYHNIRWISPAQLGGAPGTTIEASAGSADQEDSPPLGYAKSILPCTPLAVVKCLESMNAYDFSLPYGDRLYGKTITVVNRSEVVGRPLAALLSNDGAKVYSVDLDSVQEFNKRAKHDGERQPSKTVVQARERNAAHRIRPHHVVRPCRLSVRECIAASDIVISGVPSASFKIETAWIKEGAMTVNFSSEKNFEKDVRTRASVHLPAIGKTTIAMLQRNLLRLVEYRELTDGKASASSDGANGTSGPPAPPNGGGAHDLAKENGGDGQRTNGVNGQSNNSQLQPPLHGASQRNGNAESDRALTPQPRTVEQDVKMNDENAEDRHRPRSAGEEPSQQSGVSAGQRFTETRERAGTLSFARQDLMRDLRGSIQAQASPPVSLQRMPAYASGWERRSPAPRSDSFSSSTHHGAGQTPPFGPSSFRPTPHSSQPPLLFAPIGAASGHHMGNGHPSRSGPHATSSPRSGTPVSPLIIDGLSVEDNGPAQTPGTDSQRLSWDSGPPRTPYDACDMPLPPSRGGVPGPGSGPSVLERSERDQPHIVGSAPPPHEHLRRYPSYPPGFGPPAPMSPYIDEKMMLDPRRQFMGMQTASVPAFPSPAPSQQQLMHEGQLTSQQPSALQQSRAMPQDRIAHSRRRRRPPFSYSSLIAQAIASSPEGRLTLREIYTWISNAYPDLYSMEGSEGSGWQNTVRHNLSLNKAFIKVARTAQDIYDSCSSGVPSLSQQARGKGGWWMLDPNVNPATIGASTKMDDEAENGGRVLRRRRTNSVTASIASDDGDLASPLSAVYPPSALQAPVPLPPSVLQQRGRAYSTSVATTNGGENAPQRADGLPSVLRSRPRSVERGPATQDDARSPHVAARLLAQRTRPRGYTTSSADVPMHGGPQQYMSSPIGPRHGLPLAPPAHSVPASTAQQGAVMGGMSPAVPGNHNLPPYVSAAQQQFNAGPPPPTKGVRYPSAGAARYSASPAGSATTRNLPPAPASVTPGPVEASPLYGVSSPQKRKLRFDGQPGLPSAAPAYYPGSVGESPLVRASGMPTPSPLSGSRAALGPPPLPMSQQAAGMQRQASMDSLAAVAAAARRRETASETMEREAKGSRMSITGLLNV